MSLKDSGFILVFSLKKTLHSIRKQYYPYPMFFKKLTENTGSCQKINISGKEKPMASLKCWWDVAVAPLGTQFSSLASTVSMTTSIRCTCQLIDPLLGFSIFSHVLLSEYHNWPSLWKGNCTGRPRPWPVSGPKPGVRNNHPGAVSQAQLSTGVWNHLSYIHFWMKNTVNAARKSAQKNLSNTFT